MSAGDVTAEEMEQAIENARTAVFRGPPWSPNARAFLAILTERDQLNAEVAALRHQLDDLRVVAPELHAGIVEELWIEEGPRFAANPREAFEKGVKVTNMWFLRNLQKMEATYTREELAEELRADGVIFDAAGLDHELARRNASRICPLSPGEVVATPPQAAPLYTDLPSGSWTKEGDEMESSNDPWRDEPKWVSAPAGLCVRDPAFPAHTRFRRPATPPPDADVVTVPREEWEALRELEHQAWSALDEAETHGECDMTGISGAYKAVKESLALRSREAGKGKA